MSTGAIIGILIAVVVVLVLGAMVVRLTLQQRELRSRFGPEFDRVMEDQTNRRSALRELSQRERRHAELDLQPISATSRDRYRQSWALIQSKFVDRPSSAVDEADRLVLSIMEERGYPIGEIGERLALLSVDHASVLGHYREAYDTRERHQQSQVSTEELRTAMVHYRWLVEDLLEVKPTLSRPKRPTAPPARPTPAVPSPVVPPTAAVPPIPAAPPGVPAARIGDGHAAQPEKEVKRDEPVEVESTSEDTVDGKVDEPVADERQSPNSSRSVDA